MKYFAATLYLAAGIILPIAYVNMAETTNILGREWILILTVFVFCTIAGLNWLFGNKTDKSEAQAAKPKTNPFSRPQPKKITRPAAAEGPTVTAPRYVEPVVPETRRPAGTTYPPSNKPDLKMLMEDVKNFIKLESWLMAMQKANEIIHFYPDSPEADKVRGNINFLIQKVKDHD